MRRVVRYAMVAAALLGAGTPAWAQQPGHLHGPGPAGADQAQMEMCRQMMGRPGMGGMSMGGMMGMMPMMGGDPRQQAEMMAMRGEMMKAMGDIMIKYAQRLQPAK